MKAKQLSILSFLLLVVSFNTTAQDNTYFCSEAFSAGVKPTNQIALNPKDDGGKKVLKVQPAKGAMKMFSFGVFKESENDSKALGQLVYTPQSSFSYAEGKYINGNDRLVEVEKGTFVLYVPEKNNPTVKMAFAKDEASAKEWAGEKGLNKIKELEKAGKEKEKADEAAMFEKEYANSWMPKPGKLHTPENVAKAKKAIEDRILKDGGTIQKVVILSDDWDVVRNKKTGIIVGRRFNAMIAETHPNRAEGWCMKFLCTIFQEHDGSDFSGAWKNSSIGQTLNYGPIYIHVRDLNNEK
jgi:hypothetical protein